MHKSKITNPHAAVIVWNYADRINADGAENVDEIHRIIINTASLISISTSKRKSSPAGSFEFHLAPTYNWIARITPGSWCVLLMSQNKPIPQSSAEDLGVADQDTLKMIGRIDSVRLAVEVDQETGTRRSTYVVTGQDWGSVFDTKLYIDPIVRNNNYDKLTAIGHAARLCLDNFILSQVDKKIPEMPTSSDVVSAMIDLWGAPLSDISSSIDAALKSGTNPIKLEKGLQISSDAQFKLPTQVAQYIGLAYAKGAANVHFAKAIRRYDGILKSYDTYSGDNKDSNGFPDPMSMYKVNSFWQILTDNCNPIVNELVTDIRWEKGVPNLALYKRVKPFLTRDLFTGHDQPQVERNTSKFYNVRRIEIPLEDVIGINVGTNWRDKFNFIEIRPQPQLNQSSFSSEVKLQCQVIDRKAYEREGFRPLIQDAHYMPYNGGTPAPLEALQWKYLMQEWYFNTHLMLNGACTIIGQNQYIQVGDNIQIPASVLGPSSFSTWQEAREEAYLTAHVESVNHTFSVSGDGARTFQTNVLFVRGVITNKDGTMIDDASNLDGAIDRNSKDLTTEQEKNRRVFGTSTITDPDKSKLKGT